MINVSEDRDRMPNSVDRDQTALLSLTCLKSLAKVVVDVSCNLNPISPNVK